MKKRISFNISESHFKRMEHLVEIGEFPSINEIIREAIVDIIDKKIAKLTNRGIMFEMIKNQAKNSETYLYLKEEENLDNKIRIRQKM